MKNKRRMNDVWIYGEDGTFFTGEVCIDEERFQRIARISTKEQPRYFLIPGLIDVHMHGCMGADFSDGDLAGLQKMAAYEASVGVTSFCPASMTIPEELLYQAMKCAGDYKGEKGAHLAGIHMEGPFISPDRKGAQASENIRKCDSGFYHRMQKAAEGKIKIVDLAPEEDGAMEMIHNLKEEVVLSISHSSADYDTAMRAFENGACHVTHLYNAMPPFLHRDPGIIGAARDTRECTIELICDGIHVHPSVIRATFAMFGSNRIILVSDSMRATGKADGCYTLGGQEVNVCGNRATLADGTIAGSVTNLMDCVRYAVKEAKIPLEMVLQTVTKNPAERIGIDQEYGSITEGKYADFVILDENLELADVFIHGSSVMNRCTFL